MNKNRKTMLSGKAAVLQATVLLLFLLMALVPAGGQAPAQVDCYPYTDSVQLIIERELSPYKYDCEHPEVIDTLWHPDILGDGYEACYMPLPRSFDGPVKATLVRRRAPGHSGKAVLYVHGFNDYFFQAEMGRKFNERGVNFYAVDLRRYGRSLEPWQYPFNVRDMEEYFEDIDAALSRIRRDGNTDITLSGHSTGGLTTALYVAERGARCGVTRLVTDSPFLEWNFNATYRHLLIPAVTLWSRLSPDTKIKQSHCDAYSHSLLQQFEGEWKYNTAWKMVYSPPVTASWIGSVTRAQRKLMKHARNITVPVLVMHSSRGFDACSWTRECMSADVVLDPDMIAKRGARLGSRVKLCTIDGGMHDLILSEKKIREAAYDTIFSFIGLDAVGNNARNE